MQNISKINKNNKEILKKIKENISELSNNNNGINEKEFNEIKTDIVKIHNELNKFENKQKLRSFVNDDSKDNLNEIQENEIEQGELLIKKKLQLKIPEKANLLQDGYLIIMNFRKMKISKIIIYNLFAFILSVNTLYLYFGEGAGAFSFTKGYLLSILSPFVVLCIIFVMTLFVNLSYIVSYSKYKKNLLRIALIIISILLIISIIGRIIEFTRGYFCFVCILNTIFYLILLLINVSMLKELYRLIKKLFSNNS